MSVEALQCVADAYERWNRGDYAGAAELFAEDAEWQTKLDAFGGQVVSGRDGLEAMFRRLREELDLSVNFRRLELIGDKVLVEVFASGQHDSDPIEEWFQVFTFDGEAISQVVPFASHGEAMAAAEA